MLESVKKTPNWSVWILLLLIIWMTSFRLTHVDKNEISWDVFGYYLPLQATFIEGDMWMDDRSWVEELNEKHNVSGSLYQISTTPDNQPMYFFFLGMSMMYSVFFFVGHFSAGILGYSQDGLSEPYNYALIIGCLIYTIIGLYYLRKILLRFFSDELVAVLLFICVIATNFSHHMTLKNLETVNPLFMLVTIVLWNTIRWYEDYKMKNMLAIGVSIVLMALIKPSEVLIILLPIFWGIQSRKDIKDRLNLFLTKRKQIFITILVGAIIISPQIVYWYVKTGMFFYDSYKNPGVGLDFLSPHFLDSLFSYRKGWLLYTPIMIFAWLGFIIVFKQRRDLFIGLFVPFIVAYYVIASWTEYWYGASFSNRPVIAQYPLLLISMGFFFKWAWTQKRLLKYSILSLGVFFTFLNQFQWWQVRNYILDGTRMTKEYYWTVFLKKKVDANAQKLLLINRSYIPEEVHLFSNRQNYVSKNILFDAVINTKNDTGETLEYIHTVHKKYSELSSKDHCYVHFTMDYQLKDSVSDDVYFAVMMNRKNGDYNNYYFKLNTSSTNWQKLDTFYLTPELRNVNDDLKFFIWNPNLKNIDAKNLKVEVFEKKILHK